MLVQIKEKLRKLEDEIEVYNGYDTLEKEKKAQVAQLAAETDNRACTGLQPAPPAPCGRCLFPWPLSNLHPALW